MDAGHAAERIWAARSIHPNPGFESDSSIERLACDSTLDADCAWDLLCESRRDLEGEPLRLCRRQVEAIGIAKRGESFVLTDERHVAREVAGLLHPRR